MKSNFFAPLLLLLLIAVFSGCHLFNIKPPDEPEGEGEPPIEGEPAIEGETPFEGEAPVEGESPEETPLFTSADAGYGYRDGEPVFGEEPPSDIEDGTDGGERTLVEPDIIRRVDNILFILNQYRGLTVVDLDSEALLSQTATYGYPRDLYLRGDQAYVLVSYAQQIDLVEGMLSVTYGSRIYVLNIADPSDIQFEGTFMIPGDLVDSRLVGDVLYAVCSDYTWYAYTEDATGAGRADTTNKWYGQTWAVSLNIAEPDDIRIVDEQSIPGYGNLIQATNYAIFSVTQDYSSGNSVITYIDIDDPSGAIVIRGTAQAPGYMADRFKMDAWKGVLRVVTNTWWPFRETYVTTYDITNPDLMTPLGQTQLENASGETTFATRFDGPRAYIVTYLMVDPLFVVDLSDPAEPKVRGELKIPGWSTHIEPQGDRLIALGVDDEGGGRRVMVSLFDVSDPGDPQRLDYVSFGDNWSWSAAYGDVKAFTVLDNVILVPFSGWNHGYGGYDRLQFVAYTRDRLDLMGYVDLQGSALRSFNYEGLYYAVTQEQLAVIDAGILAAPRVLRSVTLAENVTDVAPLPNGWTVEIVVRNDTGDTLLRASDRATGAMGGAAELPTPTVTESFAWGNAVAVVAAVYEYEPVWRGYYQVFLVDFTNPEHPEITGRWEIELEPWWGGWWGYYHWDIMMPEPAAAKYMPYYGGGYSTNSVLLAGDHVVLRGYRKDYDYALGSEESWEGIALVDLAGAREPVYVGLGLEPVIALDAPDDLLYITTRKYMGVDEQHRSLCAYYLQFLDPATVEISRALNVPGIFLHRLPGTRRLLFEDTQYAENWQTITILRSTLLEEDRVVLVDSAKLPPGYWTVKAEGPEIFYSGYNQGVYDYSVDLPDVEVALDDTVTSRPHPDTSCYIVSQYAISRSGTFLRGDTLEVSRTWSNLLDVKGSQVYLAISSAAVAQCDFQQSPPVIVEVAAVMGYPRRIRFSSIEALIPLGYSGLLAMPL